MTKKQIKKFEKESEDFYQSKLSQGVRMEVEVLDIFSPSVCVRFFKDYKILKKDYNLLNITRQIQEKFKAQYN